MKMTTGRNVRKMTMGEEKTRTSTTRQQYGDEGRWRRTVSETSADARKAETYDVIRTDSERRIQEYFPFTEKVGHGYG